MGYRYLFIGGLLVVIGVMVACNIYSLIPLYTAIASEMEISSNQVAFGSTFFTLFYAFGLLVFGPISDYAGRKTIIILGMFLSFGTTILVVTADTPFLLYLYRGLQGFTLASFAPVAFSYSFDIFQEKDRTLWISLINAGFLAAGIIGQLISGFIVQATRWEHVYLFFSIIYFLLFIIGFFCLPNSNGARQKEEMKQVLIQMKSLLKKRRLLRCYCIVITLLLSFMAFYEGLSYLLITSSQPILAVRSIGLVGIFLSFFTGKFIKKYSAWRTLKSGILLGWSSLLLLFFSHSLFFIGVFSIFFVGSISLLIPTIIHIIGDMSGNLRGKALSLYSFILLIGASLGSLLASFISYKIILLFLLVLFTINYFIAHIETKIQEKLN